MDRHVGRENHSNDIFMVLDWDGKAITGTINPGTDNIVVKNATLNPEGWVVHLEADGKDKAGAGDHLRDRRQDREPGDAQPLRDRAPGRASAAAGPFKISRQ